MMTWENIVPYAVLIALTVGAALAERRKSKRYGGYRDPVKFRVRFWNFAGLHRKRPEDSLYDDDGKINRRWKP